MAEVDQEILAAVVFKLLDKAGHNPLLTARKLRAKAEEKMFGKEDYAGKLRPLRNKIKDIIMLWDEKEKERELAILKLLLKISKVGAAPQSVLAGLSDISSRSDRITEFRKRLRAHGYVFSDVPTEEEIQAIEQRTLLKKDMDGIDPSAIISEPRKRKNDAEESTTTAESTKPSSSPVVKKVKVEGVTVKTEPSTTSSSSSSTKPTEIKSASSPAKPSVAKKVVYSKDGDEAEAEF